ncbi:SH3 domain-containing protein [Flavobacterium sp. LS1R49]|uniref:SH3 domain-containing protein n=1 Tax=Flavobacterium shii TaxID=2987687 RepID=A0A9X2ZC34_9FLAO|nr:SH3 domain-containing protein [Flavobacterium shii]MCV9926932.1 SH3 domain-containing protein [Flavobacterium shii]
MEMILDVNRMRMLLLVVFLILIGCKKADDKNELRNQIAEQNININNTNNNAKLSDGIDLSKSFIKDIEFHKFKYENEFIENIKISSLQDNLFRMKFFNFLNKRNFDKGEYEQVYFIKLLLVRIQQTNDEELYYVLNELFNDNSLSYHLEDYELSLFELFLYKPSFFIRGACLFKKNNLVDYINKSLPSALLTNEKYFVDNLADCDVEKSSLLIDEETVDKFSIKELKEKIKTQSFVNAYFSPSITTAWKSKTIVEYNILPLLEQNIKSNLNEVEQKCYRDEFKSLFESYIIHVYKIQDSDGFTNLRKEKSSTSAIIEKIKSGEKIQVLNNSGDWWLVRTNSDNKGYVYKSKIKSE